MLETLPLIARNWALFLDIDGTLLDYAPTPEGVEVPPLLRQTLARLSEALGGALALVTGRRIADVDRIFAPLQLSVAGQHGAEARRFRGEWRFALETPSLESIVAPIHAYVAEHPGVTIRIENKELSAAIHYRGAEEHRGALERLLEGAIAQSKGEFRMLPGHLVFDVMKRGIDKGAALDWFMAEPPFQSRVPVFAGDETTDEDGFAASLARGGYAIRVGPARESVASWQLRSPQEMRDWLQRSAAALAEAR
jgi:trehalose 6-phosphate phosphatase